MTDTARKAPDFTRYTCFMGYKSNGRGGFSIRICCLCPDKTLAEKQAVEEGWPVTHSICTTHYEAQMKKWGLD